MIIKAGQCSFITLLILFFTVMNYAQPEKLRFERLTIVNGLSNNHISHIFQDREGFLWISTQDGINRYDGYRFKHYKHVPGDTNSLSDYATNHIFEDSKGTFWVSTRDGLNEFNPDKEKFIHHKPQKNNPHSISSEKIVAVREDTSARFGIKAI